MTQIQKIITTGRQNKNMLAKCLLAIFLCSMKTQKTTQRIIQDNQLLVIVYFMELPPACIAAYGSGAAGKGYIVHSEG